MEPTYVFIKGKGWVASVSPSIYILKKEDAADPWVMIAGKRFPAICKDWKVMEHLPIKHFEIGDIVPYTICVKQVTEFLGRKIIEPIGNRIYNPEHSGGINISVGTARFYNKSYSVVLRPCG